MNKRGVTEAALSIFSIIVAVLFVVIGNGYVDAAYSGNLYEHKITAKNLELLIRTSCLTDEGTLLLDYRLNQEGLTLDVKKEDGVFLFEVEKNNTKFSFKIPEEVCKSDLTTLGKINAYTLEIVKEKKNIKLSSKESFETFEFENIEIGTLERVSLSWPVPDRVVTSCYGTRDCKGCNDEHKGVDIRAPIGTEVKVMYPGKVIEINEAWGSVLIEEQVNNQDLTIKYLHLSEIDVNLGDEVERNDVIGLSGDKVPIGSIDPHLHIQTRINNKHFDPLNYFETDTIRSVESANCIYNSADYSYKLEVDES